MSEYLHDIYSQEVANSVIQLFKTLKLSDNESVWLLGDNSFCSSPLSSTDVLNWQPVFVTETMSQYEEMGLFIAPLALDEQGIQKLLNQMERFSGLPMLSIFVSDKSIQEIQQTLTWLSDARTTDNLDLYLRIGDSRCFPYILENLSKEQKIRLALTIRQWYSPERSALWKKKVVIPVPSKQTQEFSAQGQHIVISEKQFGILLNEAEVDLVYSTMGYPEMYFGAIKDQAKRFEIIRKLVQHFKKDGVSDTNQIKQKVINYLLSKNVHVT